MFEEISKNLMAGLIEQTNLSRSLATLAIILVVLQTVRASSISPWPYLQVYPPVNESDGRTPLYFALMLSTGGQYTSIGALPGVQVALDYVNSQPNILPGYSIHYTFADSQCNRATALESLFHQMLNGPTKVGWVGSGCSVATEPTAELTHFYNITQLSCVSSSPELSDRRRFRYYFQLLTNEVQTSQGFLGIIRRFGWKKVAIITQNENLFTLSMDVLKRSLTMYDIAFSEKVFRSNESIDGLMPEPFDPDARIFVLSMYSHHTRALLCEAYKQGISYPKHLFLIYGWYVDGWWIERDSGMELSCTQEEIAETLQYTLATRSPDFYTNSSLVTEGGLTASEFEAQYWKRIKSSLNAGLPVNLTSLVQDTPFVYAQHCHEAMLAFTFALNKTILDLEQNMTLNMEAAQKAGLSSGERFLIDNFTYSNSVVVERMFHHLQNTDFLGITGNVVEFDPQGTRKSNTQDVLQYHPGEEAGNPEFVQVGVVMDTKEDGSLFTSGDIISEMDMWPDGIPNDGIPIEEVVTVAVPLTVVFVILATAGLLFTVVCLAFNFIFRKKKLIRLSSPNLNYLIGAGAILLYADVIFHVIPTTSQNGTTVFCNVTPWLISLGYSLCYGTIVVKMARVWYIFNNPIIQKKYKCFDRHLTLAVLCLVVIDVLILGLYMLVEGVRGQLEVKRIINRENPEDVIGPTAEVHQYYLYVCQSNGRVALFAVLYGYKGLLQVIALLLAFRTRKVKAKGLDDSKYIAAAVYITSIVLAVIIVATYTLADYVNVFPAVVGAGFLLGTTMILVLVFVPRMIGLYKDPDGQNIELTSSIGAQKPSVLEQSSGEAIMEKLRYENFQLKLRLKQYEMSPSSFNGNAINNGLSASKEKFSLERNKTEQIETMEVALGAMEQGPIDTSSRKQDSPDT